MAEVDDVTSHPSLQAPRGLDLGKQKPAREKTARLLAEADQRAHDDTVAGCAVTLREPIAAWRIRLKQTHAAHPMKLNQR